MRLLACMLLAIPLWAFAATYLRPEQAFQARAYLQDPHTVQVIIDIAPHYYLYRKRLHWEAEPASVAIGEVRLPQGQIKHDPNFNEDLEIYHDQVAFNLPIAHPAPDTRLNLSYQGCAEQGLCYPPQHLQVRLSAQGGALTGVQVMPPDGTSDRSGSSGSSGTGDSSDALAAWRAAAGSSANGSVSDSASDLRAPAQAGAPQTSGTAAGSATGSFTAGSALDRALQAGHWWQVVGVFFVAGVLLSLTPCVLPLVPILSSIIVGAEAGRAPSRGRHLLLAASYSLGMALVYTAVGVAAGLVGQGLTNALQTPWALGGFAALLVLLSLSMFGVYTLQLPHALQSRISVASGRLPGGQLLGVLAMGMLSALIVGPCVSAPLAAALIYIGTTHDARLGGVALFSMACGMSVPLMLVGLSANSLLPRAGAWMNQVKVFFGFLLLGVALWMVVPLLPAWVFMSLLGLLLVTAAVFCFRLFDPIVPARRGWQWAAKVVGLALVLAGGAQWVGVMAGGDDALHPLAALRGGASSTAAALPFQRVHSVAEFQRIAQGSTGVVVLDFYADWCVSCKEMDRWTFGNADIARRLSGATLLRADVTDDTADNRALLQHFGLFGPPATLFFRAGAQEISPARTVGYLAADAFAKRLSAAGL